MEAVEDPSIHTTPPENEKVAPTQCQEDEEMQVSEKSDVCHRSNGDAASVSEPASSLELTEVLPTEHSSDVIMEDTNAEVDAPVQEQIIIEEVDEVAATTEEISKVEPIVEENSQDLAVSANVTEEEHEVITEGVEIDGIVENMSENIRFETEILIETNVDDQTTKYQIIYEDTEQYNNANNVLSDIGQNIELSEVLRSSNVCENTENNNCEVTQEVFNKEELLDILEGNERGECAEFVQDCKKLESQLAMQQLTRLKQTRKAKSSTKKTDKRSTRGDASKESVTTSLKRGVRQKDEITPNDSSMITERVQRRNSKQKDDNAHSNSIVSESNKNKKRIKQKDVLQSEGDTEIKEILSKDMPTETKQQKIVKALVQDWDDEEQHQSDDKPDSQVIEESNKVLQETDGLIKDQEVAVNDGQTTETEPSTAEHTPSNVKNTPEAQPQRRLSRVIKKKVIFDPDNPDTFTKTKVTIKKENQLDKDLMEQPTLKKARSDETPRSKSKSPIQSKLQWKKPQPKNLKPNKRLTEIDRLLMDEGAVNMICQLTPEAPQGNKNTKSKAEFIKKIQSSTPEGKEMKFRERKKESKSEERDTKKTSSKERLLNSSMKSPTASEEFEAHCADDSIIYRRHSSSSYSSPCMSPRRMSDVDGLNQNTTPQQELTPSTKLETPPTPSTDMFTVDTPATPIINKNNLMSIKEKLNSKLSQALNKRKRETVRPEKPSKIKRVSQSADKSQQVKIFKYIKLTICQSLAEICILTAGAVFNVEVINELRSALDTVEENSEVSVTLLTSEKEGLCLGLQLDSVLDPDNGANHAIELAESVRLLLSGLESHSKLVCTVAEDSCWGVALAVAALSDVCVASESCVFQLTRGNVLQPAAAALAARRLPPALINELIILERLVSAAEAARHGLVTRTVWPQSFISGPDDQSQVSGGSSVKEQARAIAMEIACLPHQNILLKKQLLRLKRNSSEFQSALQAERDLFVKYWTSDAAKQMIRHSMAETE